MEQQSLVIDDYGIFVGKRSERVVVKKDKEVVKEIPFFKLKEMMISSSGVSFSSDLIQECAKAGIQIDFVNYRGQHLAKLSLAAMGGTKRHERNEELEPRRTLQRYGLEKGEKRFGVKMSSNKLNLKGEMDMMVVQENNYIPIELKYTTHQPGINHKYQLIAYCLLVEEKYQVKINKGLIHLIPAKETIEVELTSRLREKVNKIISGINSIMKTEEMPEPTNDGGKCRDCEYKNYCGDI